MDRGRKNLELLHPTPSAENYKRLLTSEMQVSNGQSFIHVTKSAACRHKKVIRQIFCYHLINKLNNTIVILKKSAYTYVIPIIQK